MWWWIVGMVLIVYLMYLLVTPSPPKLTREATELLEKNIDKDVEEESRAMSQALNSAPLTNDEEECACQMRAITKAGHLKYETLAREPSTLLRVSRHVATEHGALYTRFTVQYNLYAGSVVAMGTDEQREQLYNTQAKGELGCFAFTECGAGVLSGAGVETTATYNAAADGFVIHTPTASARKQWISQGAYAEHAVILASLIMDGGNGEDDRDKDKGPHLFWARIAAPQDSADGDNKPQRPPLEDGLKLTPVKGVTVEQMTTKTALRGLDNAFISFDRFFVPRSALLARYSSVAARPKTKTNAKQGGEAGGATAAETVTAAEATYSLSLPAGTKRMLDVLLSRLLTGRLALSEFTLAYAQVQMLQRRSWQYCKSRELWQGRKERAASGGAPKLLISMPLPTQSFNNWALATSVVQHYLAHTRERVAAAVKANDYSAANSLVEGCCVCKFVGTSVGVDLVSNLRKLLGSRALLAGSGLGDASFVCNATCAAEGDNTIMELKVVGDMVRGRVHPFLSPPGLFHRSAAHPLGRRLLFTLAAKLARAVCLHKAALADGQLLRDIAWARAHLLMVDVWVNGGTAGRGGGEVERTEGAVEHGYGGAALEAYGRLLVRFPVPLQY